MTYPIGSQVWGDRLIKCEVLKVQRQKSTGDVRYWVRCPDGDRYITPEQIRGHDPPKCITTGSRVRLKNTNRAYTVKSIYAVRFSKEGDTEDYCKLVTETKTAATWKLKQLELLED